MLSAPKTIGLIGGLGPGTTVLYYRAIIDAFTAAGYAAPLFIANADISTVKRLMDEGALEEMASYFARLISSLERSGAQLVAIGAIAPHMCAPRLEQLIASPLVNPIDCMRAELKRRSVERIAILGSRFVMESAVYGFVEAWETVRLSPAEIDFVHETYMRVAVAGGATGSGADIERLRATAQDLVERGADIVVLAGTDLSLVFQETDCGFPALDCVRLHVDAIVADALVESAGAPV